MSCEIKHESLKAYLDGELPLLESLKMRVHLSHCASCREERTALQEFSAKLKEDDTPLSSNLRSRILNSVSYSEAPVVTTARPAFSRAFKTYAWVGTAMSLIAGAFFINRMQSGTPALSDRMQSSTPARSEMKKSASPSPSAPMTSATRSAKMKVKDVVKTFSQDAQSADGSLSEGKSASEANGVEYEQSKSSGAPGSSGMSRQRYSAPESSSQPKNDVNGYSEFTFDSLPAGRIKEEDKASPPAVADSSRTDQKSNATVLSVAPRSANMARNRLSKPTPSKKGAGAPTPEKDEKTRTMNGGVLNGSSKTALAKSQVGAPSRPVDLQKKPAFAQGKGARSISHNRKSPAKNTKKKNRKLHLRHKSKSAVKNQ